MPEKYLYIGGIENTHPEFINGKSYLCSVYPMGAYIIVSKGKEKVLDIYIFAEHFKKYKQEMKKRLTKLIDG